MKVALINTELTRGGAARMAATLTRTLNTTGSVAATLYHCQDSETTDQFIGLRRLGSRQLNAALARLGGSSWVVDFGVAKQISASTSDFDLLHLHNLHGYYLNYRTLLSHWRDRPIVWTWHDMWGATGRCGFSESCEGWRSGCAPCPNLPRYPAAWFDRAAAEHKLKQQLFVDRKDLWIISPSKWLADIAVKRGYRANRIFVIPNPVDTILFQPVARNEARQLLGWQPGSTALFVASDCNDTLKGYTDFASATAATNVTAIAVGKPPSQPATHVIHTGRLLDQKQLNLHYAAADMLVIPSYADNYPNTVIESLASGTPVVGYATGGIPSQIDNPYCRVVPTGNLIALAEAIKELASGEGKNTSTSGGCAELSTKRWHPVRIAEQYKEIYEKAISSHQGLCT